MLLNSTTGLVILALVLVAGWLLGLASSSGGKTWKARYLAERDAHAAYRKDADARIALSDQRHGDLEREHVRLRQATPAPVPAPVQTRAHDTGVLSSTGATAASLRPHAEPSARPAHAMGGRRGWFDWNSRSA